MEGRETRGYRSGDWAGRGAVDLQLRRWQVTSRTARAEIRAGIVEQQAMFCEARARADISAPGQLDWTARYELAVKWAAMPGAGAADSDVTSACARKLAA